MVPLLIKLFVMSTIENVIQNIVRQENERLLSQIRALLLEREQPQQAGTKLMTIDELAQYISSTKSQVYKLTSKKEVLHIKKNKRLYFEKSKIDKWIREASVPTSSEINEEAESLLMKVGRSKEY